MATSAPSSVYQQNGYNLPTTQQNSYDLPATYQNGYNLPATQQNNAGKPTTDETKAKVTLEERVSRGEARTGPTVPLLQAQSPSDYEPSPNVRQVYPPLSPTQQQEQQKQAQQQANQSGQQQEQQKQGQQQQQPNQPTQVTQSSTTEEKKVTTEEQKKPEGTTSTAAPSSQQSETKQKQEVSPEEEKKIVESVIKQLTPLVEQFVASEIRRALSGQTDSDDENGFLPFPFLFGGAGAGGPLFASGNGGVNGNIPNNVSGAPLPQGFVGLPGGIGGLS